MNNTLESLCGLDIQTVDLDGQMLRVGVRHGSSEGPPLLIFNGIGSNIEMLEKFVSELGDVSVVIFDVPGVGGSPAPYLPYRFTTLAVLTDRLLTRLGFKGPVDVLGLSWGGALAQQFALLYPVRCRRLILAATTTGMHMVPAEASVMRKMLSPRRYTDPAYMVEIGGELYGGSYRRDPELIREHSRHVKAPKGNGYMYQLMALWGWSSLPWLKDLRQKTLVIHGNDDPIIPLVNAEIIASRIKNATLHVIDDGHLFLVARAKEAAALVQAFLRLELID